MYNLPHFKEKDQAVVVEFMRQHPFAMLIGCSANVPAATQVPLLFEVREGRMILTGHMMRKQDHHLAFKKNPQVLVVFTGPHAYVSATLYSDPQQASTWNYMSVHARGTIQFLGEKGLENALRRLTLQYENNDPGSATIFDNLPDEYRRKLMKSIIAFEIEIQSLENVFKLSQNRDKQSYGHIINHLHSQEGDGHKIAREMERRRAELFTDDYD